MKKALLYLPLVVLLLCNTTTIAARAHTTVVQAPVVVTQEGYEAGQSVRASLLQDYGGNPHNSGFQAAINEESEAARIYRASATTPEDYSYWNSYIQGLNER